MSTLGIHRNLTLINSKGEESSVAGGQFVMMHACVLTVTAKTYTRGTSSGKVKTRKRTYRECSMSQDLILPLNTTSMYHS